MATVGPNYAGTVVNDATTGTKAWANPSNAQGSGLSLSTVAQAQQLNVLVNVQDSFIYLAKAGVIQTGTTNKSAGATWTIWDSVSPFTINSFGGAADLWGNTLAMSDVNDTGFGVAMAPLIMTGTPVQVQYLLATNFGFAIPSGATINGILAEFSRVNSQQNNNGLSFVKDTLVMTPNGEIPIQALQTGDRVISWYKGRYVVRKIKNILVRTKPVSRLRTEEGAVVVSTNNERFKLETGRFKELTHLRPGDRLFMYQSRCGTVGSIDSDGTQEVFSLCLDKPHNYFANEFCVHNVAFNGLITSANCNGIRMTTYYTPAATTSGGSGMLPLTGVG